MFSLLRPALVLLGLMTLATGVIYPVVVTGVARVIFPHQASGSSIERSGRVVGSTLIGQSFDDARYFWGRPSATSPVPYNSAASTGSNLGPTNPALVKLVGERVATLRAADPSHAGALVPVDLVTSSGSGLDAHISPAAAYYQVTRVAQARGFSEQQLRRLVEAHVEGRTWGILGEPRVNVLRLNLALDDLLRSGA